MNKVKLGEVLHVKHGWAFKGEYFSTTGKQSILTPGNFYEKGGFKPNNGKERYYSGKYPNEYLCRKGDLIVAMTQQAAGLLGSTALVPEDDKYLHNQRIGLITCDEKKLIPLYAYYLFMTKSVREQIERTASGTKVKHTSPEKIYDVSVSIPDVSEQEKISACLMLLERKILLNNRINDNLQRQLKLLYDEWFTRFDFPDKNGRPYRTAGGLMRENPTLRRPIPAGWEVVTVGDILVENPKSDIQVGTAKTAIGIYPFFTSGDAILEWSEALVKGRNCFMNTGGNADIKFYVGAAAYSTDTWCITGKNNFSDYLYLLLESMRPELKQKYFQGTGLKHLQKKLLMKREICIPPEEILVSFNRRIQPQLTMISQNIRENKKLTELRDWLLPLLMNGQATIL